MNLTLLFGTKGRYGKQETTQSYFQAVQPSAHAPVVVHPVPECSDGAPAAALAACSLTQNDSRATTDLYFVLISRLLVSHGRFQLTSVDIGRAGQFADNAIWHRVLDATRNKQADSIPEPFGLARVGV